MRVGEGRAKGSGFEVEGVDKAGRSLNKSGSPVFSLEKRQDELGSWIAGADPFES